MSSQAATPTSDSPSDFGIEAKSYTFYTSGLGTEVVEKAGKKEYFATGYISTADIDKVNDLVTPDAMDGMVEQLNNRTMPIKIDVEHELIDRENKRFRDIIPVGKIVEALRDERGVWVRVLLNSGIDRFKDVWNSLNNGFLDGFSITFRVKDFSFAMINGIRTRVLHLLELINVAFTGNAINLGASIDQVFAKAIQDEVGSNAYKKKLKAMDTARKITEDEDMPDKPEEKRDAPAAKLSDEELIAEMKRRKLGVAKPEGKSDEETAEQKAEKEAAEKKAAETLDAEQKAAKEVNDKLEALEKSNEEFAAEIKAMKELPIFKAAGPEGTADPAAGTEQKAMTPLGMIY